MAAAAHAPRRRARRRPPPHSGRASRASSSMLATTLLGLLAVTFFIGRVVPIDPVLAIVGDRAPPARLRPRRARSSASTCRSSSSSASICSKVADRRFRQLGAHHQSGDDRHRPRLSGDARARDPRHPASASLLGVPLGVFAAVKRGSLHRPGRARRRPGRLFGADLLARPDGPLLFYAKLGWVGGPGPPRRRLRRTSSRRVTGMLLVDTLMQGEMGRVPERALAHRPAGLRSSAISRSPISAA